MKRDLPDFFIVPEPEAVIHDRLTNWALYVSVKGAHWQGPIWKLGKSNGRQWHQPEIKPTIDTLDGHAIEKAVGMLPHLHRDAIRWFYVHRSSPAKIKRLLGVNDAGLMRLVGDGRLMLRNRGV